MPHPGRKGASITELPMPHLQGKDASITEPPMPHPRGKGASITGPPMPHPRGKDASITEPLQSLAAKWARETIRPASPLPPSENGRKADGGRRREHRSSTSLAA